MAPEPETIGPSRADAGERRRTALAAGIALDLARARVPDDVNRRLVVRAVEALDADHATLLRRTEGEVAVVAAHDRRADPPPPDGRGSLEGEALMLKAVELQVPVHDGTPAAHGDGEARTLVVPLVFDGDVIGFVTAGRATGAPFDDDDVAALQMIGNIAVVTLRNARFHAENVAAKQTMADLLSTVMHEMRAPLAIVGGYMSMIREGVFGPTPQALELPLATIQSKVHEAQRMVDELLLASRLENGDIPYRVVDVDLSDAAQRAAERAGPRATLLGAQVDVLAPETAWARADTGHVDRILDNLVNNAMLHAGPSAQVTITAVGGRQPQLLVSDTGDGVAEADRPFIFERFFRGRESATGTGLGLFISRRLAGRWGGSLDLDAGSDRGACFVLSLPPAA